MFRRRVVWLVAAIALAILAPAAALPGVHEHWHSDAASTGTGAVQGDWEIDANRSDGAILLRLRHVEPNQQWSWSSDVEVSEFTGLSRSRIQGASGPVTFSLERDAGSFRCEGRLGHGHGSGDYVFRGNPAFRAELERSGVRDVSDQSLMSLTIHDVSREWIRELQARGYRTLTLDDMVRLKIHGVDLAYLDGLEGVGYPRFEADDLVRLKIHGVDPEYIRSLALGDTRLTADDLVRLKIHGVDAEFVRDLRGLGYSDLTTDDLVRLRLNGLTSDFVRDMKGLRLPTLTADDLVRLKLHGVTPEFARRVKARHADATVDDLIRIRLRGDTES